MGQGRVREAFRREHEALTAALALCGIQVAGMSPSDYWWLPERENACGAHRDMAGVIDGRWPQAMRGEDTRVSVARRLSVQFGVDSRVSMRLIRSIIARRIMASERCGWVS